MASAGMGVRFPELNQVDAKHFFHIALWEVAFAFPLTALNLRGLQLERLAAGLVGLGALLITLAAIEAAYWRLAWGAEYHMLDRELVGVNGAPWALLVALLSLWPSNGGPVWKIGDAVRSAGSCLAFGAVLSVTFLLLRNANVTDAYSMFEVCWFGTFLVALSLALACAAAAVPLPASLEE